MLFVTVYPAIGQKTKNVQTALLLFALFKHLFNSGVGKKGAIINAVLQQRTWLLNNPASAYGYVANLGVARDAVW